MITRLKAAKIDLVYYGGYQQEMGQLLRQAQDADFHPQFFGTSGIATSELWTIAGPSAEGVLFTFAPDPRQRPERQCKDNPDVGRARRVHALCLCGR